MSYFTRFQLIDGQGAGYLAQVTAAFALKVDGSAVTQPISAAALPLPIGASTSALQTTGNNYLSTLATNLPVQGQALAAASMPVVLTAAQISTLTPLTSITVTQGTAANLLAQVSNNGTFAVQATLAAETTKVIGTVNQGTSPWVVGQGTYANLLGQMKVTDGTNFQAMMDVVARAGYQQLTDGTHAVTINSATTTSTYGLDINLRSILGTAPTTAGFIDIKGADGNVFVRQATAANLNATIVGLGTAGSPSGGVVSIQGVASGTVVPVSGNLNISQNSIVSTVNSSTAALTGNSVFTGTSESSLAYAAISIEVFSDQASATNGLSIQQSQDGTNWDIKDTFSVSASTSFQTTVNVVGQYFRIVYTNGSTNQGTFRLQTVKMVFNQAYPRTLTAAGNFKVDGSGVNQPVEITDGTHIANVLAGDNNALMIAIGENTAVYTLTGSQSANAVLASIDTLGYKCMSVHMTSIGAGISAAGVMQSGNNSNFVTLEGMNDGSTGPSLSSSVTNGAILTFPLNSRYIQISLTGTQTSGTTTIYVTLKAAPYTYPGGVMQGRFTNNSGAPGAANVGVLNAIANASAPSWTEGNQVLVSTDLSGNTRVILNAETTKVIGVVRNSDGAGNLLTSNSTTYSSKFALDMNLLGTLGTAFTTAGFVNVIGAAATGASVAQNPVYIASQATNAEITAVSSGQVAPQVSDLYGKQIISPYAGRDYFVSGVASATGTSDTSVLSSAGSGLRNYITDFSFANSGASTSVCEIKDGSGGTVLWYSVAPAGGGSNKSFNVPIRGSAATGTYCTSLTSSTTVYFSLSGFKGA